MSLAPKRATTAFQAASATSDSLRWPCVMPLLTSALATCPWDQADPARSPVLVRTPSEAGRNQATYPEHVRVSSPVSPAVPRARLRGGASHEAQGRRGARGGRAGRPPATRRRLGVLRQILHKLVAGLEQFLFVDDVVAVEDGAGLVAGQKSVTDSRPPSLHIQV